MCDVLMNPRSTYTGGGARLEVLAPHELTRWPTAPRRLGLNGTSRTRAAQIEANDHRVASRAKRPRMQAHAALGRHDTVNVGNGRAGRGCVCDPVSGGAPKRKHATVERCAACGMHKKAMNGAGTALWCP